MASSVHTDDLSILYLFAFWSQFKPSEPFLTDYLIDTKDLPGPVIYQYVFDLFIYARLPCVAFVGLLSGRPWAGCRKVLVAGASCGLTTVLLTRFGKGLLLQQLAQFTVAAAFASRIACPALVFAVAPPSHQQRGVHTLKAVMLLSNFCSAAMGEMLRDFTGAPLDLLFDISVVGQALSLLFAVMLPERTQRQRRELDPSVLSQAARRHCEWLPRQLAELQLSLWVHTVAWWTAWALWMNPIHGLAMTYWQGLVRSKHIVPDHNGSLLASMYLIAAGCTLACGNTAPLRGFTPTVVILSMSAAGLLLVRLVGEWRQWAIYGCLLLYQCLFEVTSAIATFQVGTAVTCSLGLAVPTPSKSCTEGVASGPPGGQSQLHPQLHQGGGNGRMLDSRLTLLFSATAVAAGTNENIILAVINHLRSMELRFFSLGICLTTCALIMVLVRTLEEVSAWRSTSADRKKPSSIAPDLLGELLCSPTAASPLLARDGFIATGFS